MQHDRDEQSERESCDNNVQAKLDAINKLVGISATLANYASYGVPASALYKQDALSAIAKIAGSYSSSLVLEREIDEIMAKFQGVVS